MDLAVADTGTIGVVDPVKRMVVLFVPETGDKKTSTQEGSTA
jgi:hypothetical protein